MSDVPMMDVVAYANMYKYLPPYKYLTLPRTSGVSTHSLEARQMGLGLRSGGRANLEVGLAGVRRLGSKLGSQAKVGHSGHSLITRGTVKLIATWNTTDEPQYIS